MKYDLFISYSRNDNLDNKIYNLIERIKSDFFEYSQKPLEVFIDKDNIIGMEDWRIKILSCLQESKIMLACLSPDYINSKYCEWEFNEYLKHEIDRMYFGDGIAPIYYIPVPGWETKEFEVQCAKWISDLRHRQIFDFRPWYDLGEKALRDDFVQKQMSELQIQIKSRLDRRNLIDRSIGNLSSHNRHFRGRIKELGELQMAVASNPLGIPIIIHGIEGIGKTSLVTEYALAFGYQYGGGCWNINCEDETEIHSAFVQLQGINQLSFEFTENEKKNLELQFERVIRELKSLTVSSQAQKCLIILDNVHDPDLIAQSQKQLHSAESWMQIIAISYMGPHELGGYLQERTLISIDALTEEEALEVISSYQPNSEFKNETEKIAALEIIRSLESYTLAVEAVGVFLGRFSDEISSSDLLLKLNEHGLKKLDNILSDGKATKVIHPFHISLISTIDRLEEPEKLSLYIASLMPSDCIVTTWIKTLVAASFPEFENEIEIGSFDPWINIKKTLISYSLLHQQSIKDNEGSLILYGMHKFVQNVVISHLESRFPETVFQLCRYAVQRANEIYNTLSNGFQEWEIHALKTFSMYALKQGYSFGQVIAFVTSSLLVRLGEYESSTNILSLSYESFIKSRSLPNMEEESYHNFLAVNYLNMGQYALAEDHLIYLEKLILKNDLGNRMKWQFKTSLGCLYRETCELDKAFPLLNEALRMSKDIFPSNSKEYSLSYINMGLLFQDMCRLDEAIDNFQKAVVIDKTMSEGNELNLLQDIATLSEALRNNHKDKESEAMIIEHMPLTNSQQIAHNPVRGVLLTILARIIEDRGDYVKAREYLEEAKLIAMNSYGSASLRMALYLNNLGMNSLAIGNYKEAIQEFQESIQMQSLSIPYFKFKIAHRYLNLSATQILNDDYDNASNSIKNAWNLCHDNQGLLSGRVLLLRILLSMLSNESSHYYIGQLLTLLEFKSITAPSINIRWALPAFLVKSLNKLSVVDNETWISLNASLEDLSYQRKPIIKSEIAHIGKLDLQQEWL